MKMKQQKIQINQKKMRFFFPVIALCISVNNKRRGSNYMIHILSRILYSASLWRF